MVTTLEIVILIFLSALFLVSLIMTVILAYICTAAIPTDILVSKQRELRKVCEVFRPIWEDTYEPMDLFCNICQAYVQERTKHCGPCNRCCQEFDHHCKWLNNCIGTENYENFRRLINAFLLYSLTSFLLFIQALAKSMVTEEK